MKPRVKGSKQHVRQSFGSEIVKVVVRNQDYRHYGRYSTGSEEAQMEE